MLEDSATAVTDGVPTLPAPRICARPSRALTPSRFELPYGSTWSAPTKNPRQRATRERPNKNPPPAAPPPHPTEDVLHDPVVLGPAPAPPVGHEREPVDHRV